MPTRGNPARFSYDPCWPLSYHRCDSSDRAWRGLARTACPPPPDLAAAVWRSGVWEPMGEQFRTDTTPSSCILWWLDWIPTFNSGNSARRIRIKAEIAVTVGDTHENILVNHCGNGCDPRDGGKRGESKRHQTARRAKPPRQYPVRRPRPTGGTRLEQPAPKKAARGVSKPRPAVSRSGVPAA